VPCRLKAHVLLSKKLSQCLNANVLAVNHTLSTRCNLTDNWRRITNSGRVVPGVFKDFQVPVMKCGTSAICRFRWPAVCRDKPSSERYDLLFERFQLLLLRSVQLRPTFACDLRIVLTNFFKNAAVSNGSTGNPERSTGERFFIRLRSQPSGVFAVPSRRLRQSQPATSKSLSSKSSAKI
jgi:hypothetical protein